MAYQVNFLLLFALMPLTVDAQEWIGVGPVSERPGVSMYVHQERLFVSFDSGLIMIYDGHTWEEHSFILDGHIIDFQEYKDTLYGLTYNRLLKWVGNDWAETGFRYRRYRKYGNMLVLKDTLYIAGYLDSLDSHLVKYANGRFLPVSSLNGHIARIVVHDDLIFALGNFTASGNTGLSYVAKLTDSGWSPVGNALMMHEDFWSPSFVSYEGDLYLSESSLQGIEQQRSDIHTVVLDGLEWKFTDFEKVSYYNSVQMVNCRDTLYGITSVSRGQVQKLASRVWKPIDNSLVDTMFIFDAVCYHNLIFVTGEINLANDNRYDERFSIAYLAPAIITGHEQHYKTRSFNIFPVPAGDKVQIDSPEEGKIDIFNKLGKKELTLQVEAGMVTIDIQQLPKGIYLARWSNMHVSFAPVRFVKD